MTPVTVIVALTLSLDVSGETEEGVDPPTETEVIEQVLSSYRAEPYLEDMRLAPPVFRWPANLPEPFTYSLDDGSTGTAFPAPTDTALDLYGLWCDYTPDECQRRIDAAYAQYDALESELEGAFGYAPPEVLDGWSTWEVALLVTGAAVLAVGTGFGLGYIAGVAR